MQITPHLHNLCINWIKLIKNQRITQINSYLDNKFKWNELKLLTRIWNTSICKFLPNLHNLCKIEMINNIQYSIKIDIKLGANFPGWKYKNRSSQKKLVNYANKCLICINLTLVHNHKATFFFFLCCPHPTVKCEKKNRVGFFFFFFFFSRPKIYKRTVFVRKCQIWAKNLLKFVFNGLKSTCICVLTAFRPSFPHLKLLKNIGKLNSLTVRKKIK